MFPGYGITAAHYAVIADRLASWGYAVVQASAEGVSVCVYVCALVRLAANTGVGIPADDAAGSGAKN
jgi:hypothetical protein